MFLVLLRLFFRRIDMFEQAVRMKLRYEHKGLCSVEDLWDLSIVELDQIFKKLNAELKTVKEESLLDVKSYEDKELDLKISIVKHIVAVKLAEAEANEKRADKMAKKQKILGIIARKQDAELEEMPVEKLSEMVEDL